MLVTLLHRIPLDLRGENHHTYHKVLLEACSLPHVTKSRLEDPGFLCLMPGLAGRLSAQEVSRAISGAQESEAGRESCRY